MPMKKALSLIIMICCIFGTLKMQAAENMKIRKVAILIYDGVYTLDFAGPLEIFNDTMLDDTTRAFDVFLVAPSEGKITTNTNTIITPAFSISNCPNPDLLIVPGGNLNLAASNKGVADWIKSVNAGTEVTMSVCTGAFILGYLGILDGKEATTWHGAVEKLKKSYPEIKVKAGKRFTDDGKIVTTAGVSAGIDGSLHVVERLLGKEHALQTARYIEYEYYK